MNLISRLMRSKLFMSAAKPETPLKLIELAINSSTAASRMMALIRENSGYHGSSTTLIGEHQLAEGKLEDRGGKVYFADWETAHDFAKKRAKIYGGKPLILKISSKQEPEWNPMLGLGHGWSGGLGFYQFFRAAKEIKILKAYVVEEVNN